MKVNHFAIATIATLLVGSSLVAQATAPPQTRTAPPQVRPGQTGGVESQTKDQTFAKCTAITNQEQVMLARFAKDKATNSKVKEFATTLEKEHQNTLEKLKGLSSQYGTKSDATTTSNTASNRDTTAERTVDRPATTTSNATDNRNATNNRDTIDTRSATTTSYTNLDSNSSGVNFIQLHQEMADQCLVDTKAMLSEKEGIEIDKCFVGMQIAKHAGMQTSLTVLQRHASGELQSLIKESLATNAKHMEVAINLMEQLADNDATRSTRNSR